MSEDEPNLSMSKIDEELDVSKDDSFSQDPIIKEMSVYSDQQHPEYRQKSYSSIQDSNQSPMDLVKTEESPITQSPHIQLDPSHRRMRNNPDFNNLRGLVIPKLKINEESNQDQCITFRDKQNSSKKNSEAKRSSKGSTPLDASHASSHPESERVSFEGSKSNFLGGDDESSPNLAMFKNSIPVSQQHTLQNYPVGGSGNIFLQSDNSKQGIYGYAREVTDYSNDQNLLKESCESSMFQRAIEKNEDTKETAQIAHLGLPGGYPAHTVGSSNSTLGHKSTRPKVFLQKNKLFQNVHKKKGIINKRFVHSS